MKKSLLLIAVLTLTLFCFVSLRAEAEKKGPKVPDNFEINSDAKHFSKPKSKIPPKTELCKLSHKKHADLYGCKPCHHELKSDAPEEQAKAKKCSAEGCHTANPHGPEKKIISLKSAMHNNCYKDCHKKDAKAVEAKAPTKCGECHVKIK